jgi:NADH:ubiquinone reductase (H+-translocating)
VVNIRAGTFNTVPHPPPPHVLIIGGGFGGLYAARALASAPARVTLVDRTNHHVFQPLLYQAATATLAPTDITAPIRFLLRKQRNTTVLMAEATQIDVAQKTVRIDDDATEIHYDFLVVAAGARHSYFSHPEWEPLAPGLKSIDDAVEMRRRFLLAFERAEKSTDPDEQQALLTFVIVGGGPTGVELAGMVPTIARHTLPRDFRNIDTHRTRVILVEGGPRLLPAMPPELSARARRDLEDLGVEVRTDTLVTDIGDGSVTVGGESLRAGTVFWAAGNAASALGAQLGAPLDRAGRVRVEPDLSIPGHPEVFVIGDLAAITSDGKPVPGVAPAATQGGRHAARMIQRTLTGSSRIPFRYRNKGDLATIGRLRAVADFGRFRLTGFAAWAMWLFVHILYLAGFRNRISVLIEWGYAFFTYQRGSRLIDGEGRIFPSSAPPIRPRW